MRGSIYRTLGRKRKHRDPILPDPSDTRWPNFLFVNTVCVNTGPPERQENKDKKGRKTPLFFVKKNRPTSRDTNTDRYQDDEKYRFACGTRAASRRVALISSSLLFCAPECLQGTETSDDNHLAPAARSAKAKCLASVPSPGNRTLFH